MPEKSAQLGFFEVAALCPDPETHTPPTCRPAPRNASLTRLAIEAGNTSDPLARASILRQLAIVAEAATGDAIFEANRAGRSWRTIGTQLGVPHQTVHRRHGGKGRSGD